MQRGRNGFTLLELLIVVAIIGIITAIAIPNLILQTHRAKQKRTMADMHALGTAIEAYAVDYAAYPPAAGILPGGMTYPLTSPLLLDSAMGYIGPTYMKIVPAKDGWGTPLRFQSALLNYAIVSCARKFVCVQPAYPGPTTDLETDIVFSNGSFLVYPFGVQLN